MYKDPEADLRQMNKEFCQLRNVRKSLWKQKSINEFHARLQGGGKIEMTYTFSDADEYDDGDDDDSAKEL